MGNGQQPKNYLNTSNNNFNEIGLKKLNKLSVIGRGGFGKVWKVEDKKMKKIYAMKQMSKAKVLVKKSVDSVMNELHLLKCIQHDFLINANAAFQDRQNLYLLMDFVGGGDLRYHLIKQSKFSQQNTKFFAACIMVALEFLHNNGIIHRDLKPQNLVFDKKGYLRLTDLGVARIWKPENASDTSGTPGYMAPEVMCRCNHGVSSDYYALGVIVFQCMFSFRPYLGSTRQQIRDKILSKQVQIKKKDIPFGWSEEAASFVNSLIQRKPQNRLGNNGPLEVMDHPWFQQVDWNLLRKKQIQANYIPVFKPEQYQQQLNALQDVHVAPQTLILLKKQSIQNVFAQYKYDGSKVENPLLQKLIYS